MEIPDPTPDGTLDETPAETHEARVERIQGDFDAYFAAMPGGLVSMPGHEPSEEVFNHPDFLRRLMERLNRDPDRRRMRAARNNPKPPAETSGGYRGEQEEVHYGGLLGDSTRGTSTEAEIGEMVRW